MNGRTLALHLGRLCLAAFLLWLDVRYFLFYLFTLVLVVAHQVNHLRAVVRVLSLGHDVKLVTIYERLGLTEDDVKAAADRSLERVGAGAREGLDADWRIATSGR